MHCNRIEPMLNDLLDKTLSANEQREVEEHLARCEGCRSEFGKLKRADDILREAVCEMVSGIEVPPELNHKIEMILAGERRKKTLAGRLPVFLKSPAIAAALLFTVATAVIFSFHNPFNQAVKHTEVVLAEPQSLPESRVLEEPKSVADSSNPPVTPEAVRNLAEPVKPEESKTQTNNEKAAPRDTVGAKEEIVKEETVFTMKDQVPQALGKSLPAKENRSLAATFAPAFKKGTLEEAAAEVGFNPTRPAYLPQGAVLQEVAWLSDTVYQNYQVGQISFTITQSRADMVRLNDDGGGRQGTFTDINGSRATLEETAPEAAGTAYRGTTTVRWQQGEWIFSVGGELPREEIIKIASSLK